MTMIRNSRILWIIPLLMAVCLLSFPAQAQYGGGNGEPNDPYQIATAGDLMLLGENPEDYDKHFIMTTDIDLNPNLPGRKVFDKAVISPDTNDAESWFQGIPFTGVFNGNGYVINNLHIQGSGYLGLFGRLDSGALISNLGLEAVDVNGTDNYISGLVGHNWRGDVTNCYSTGTVRGDWYVGGLVGENEDASITASYSTGTVTGDDYVGGLVGINWGGISMSYSTGTVSGREDVGGLVGNNGDSITTSYSTGSVTGDEDVGGLVGDNRTDGSITMSYSIGAVSGKKDVGGLVGENFYGSIATSFWNGETSGQSSSAGGTRLTKAKMQDIDTFLSAGWDFIDETLNGTCDCWQISQGHYPQLRCHNGDSPVIPEGCGTANEPYLIRDARDLGTVWFRPIAHYRLEASLDLSGITWSMAVVPWFGGSFDGNGHKISHLTIAGESYLGLFGQLGSRAKISSLSLEAIDVSGTVNYIGGLAGGNDGSITKSYSMGTVTGNRSFVGGLVGSNSGSITISYSTGTVTGNEHLGGLVGRNLWGSITTSYSTSTVSGGWRCVGGLVGSNYESIITTSYSTGTVNGDDDVGGFVGDNDGNITTSYSTGVVSGDDDVGGFVGYNDGSIITSYSTGMISGSQDVGGLVGSNLGSITSSSSIATVTGDKNVGGLVGYNFGGEAGNGSITTSYSTGTVTGNEYLGGLVGVNRGCIATSYSTGKVSGETRAGGLVGYNGYDGKITSSFWDMEASGLLISYGGEGKTTAKMRTASTFLEAGWDFVDETENGTEDIWAICEGTNYPRLVWQIPVGDFVCPDGVTMPDFSLFATHWLDDNCNSGNDYCEGTDLDLSGAVDIYDLEAFADNWLAGIAP